MLHAKIEATLLDKNPEIWEALEPLGDPLPTPWFWWDITAPITEATCFFQPTFWASNPTPLSSDAFLDWPLDPHDTCLISSINILHLLICFIRTATLYCVQVYFMRRSSKCHGHWWASLAEACGSWPISTRHYTEKTTQSNGRQVTSWVGPPLLSSIISQPIQYNYQSFKTCLFKLAVIDWNSGSPSIFLLHTTF